MEEDAIRALLTRLARPHPSGGKAIERAALLAAGSDFPAVMAWITEHDGRAEEIAPAAVGGGLHGGRMSGGGASRQQTPQRYIHREGVLA
jgi:hypothetical protein